MKLIKHCQMYLVTFMKSLSSPKIKTKVNSKTRLSPWITRGILRSFKRTQKLYKTFSRIEIL